MHGHPSGLPAAPADVGCSRSMVRSPRRALPATLLVITLLFGAGACSSDDVADPANTTNTTAATSSSTTAPATTTTEPKSEEEEVTEAYLEAEMLYFEIGTHPDPDDPRLAEMYGEPNLTFVRERIEHLLADGLQARYPDDALPVPEVLDLAVDGNSAHLTSCVVDNAQQVRVLDGAVVNDAVVSKKYSVELAQSSQEWKVIDGELIQKWADGDGCER